MSAGRTIATTPSASPSCRSMPTVASSSSRRSCYRSCSRHGASHQCSTRSRWQSVDDPGGSMEGSERRAPAPLGGQALLLRRGQASVEGERVAVRIVEGELARAPRLVLDAARRALDAALAVLGIEAVGVLDQEAEADGAHLVLVLELHVELGAVAAIADVVRVFRVGLCAAVGAEGELEAQLLGVKVDRPPHVARAENRLGLLEHGTSCGRSLAPTGARRPERN